MVNAMILANQIPRPDASICNPCDEVVKLLSVETNEDLCDAILRLLVYRTAARPGEVLRVRDVAEVLRKSEAWVRRHANELGVIRMGEGRGCDLLFTRSKIGLFLEAPANRTRQ